MITITGSQSGYCPECYRAGIERLCGGFTITRADGKAATAVPPLPAMQAADVRRAARQHLERHGPGDARRHPQHSGGRA
jgi:hypothetical protein